MDSTLPPASLTSPPASVTRQPPTMPTASSDGPRERLWMYGAERLSDAELVAIVLGTGQSGEPVQVLAARLLQSLGGLSNLRRKGASGLVALAELRGIGPGKASRLWAALELGRRAASTPFDRRIPIRTSRDVDAALRPRLRDQHREHFLVLVLDARNRPIAEVTIGIGGLSACGITPADVFRPVLAHPARGVILVHNHPSGDSSPSDDDLRITRRLVQVGELVGVPVLDHVVLGAEDSFSFLDAGLLTPAA